MTTYREKKQEEHYRLKREQQHALEYWKEVAEIADYLGVSDTKEAFKAYSLALYLDRLEDIHTKLDEISYHVRNIE
jgi:hypothetical protein